jgi:hypothetical protein
MKKNNPTVRSRVMIRVEVRTEFMGIGDEIYDFWFGCIIKI